MQWFKTLLLATGIAAVSAGAQAKQTICVFDIVGKSGDVYAQADLNNRAETKQRWYIWERG